MRCLTNSRAAVKSPSQPTKQCDKFSPWYLVKFLQQRRVNIPAFYAVRIHDGAISKLIFIKLHLTTIDDDEKWADIRMKELILFETLNIYRYLSLCSFASFRVEYSMWRISSGAMYIYLT